MKKVFIILGVLVPVGILIACLFHHDVKVSHLWSPVSDDSRTAVAYLTIDNKGADEDSLVAVQTEVAEHAVLKEESDKDGTRRVNEIKTLDVPGGQTKVLQPKGTYIVLTGVKKLLAKGDKFPISLVFDKRGLVEDEVLVEGGDATGYSGH